MVESVLYKTAIYYRLSLNEEYSGLNYDRLAFKWLISDIESGKINMVITKDLSRGLEGIASKLGITPNSISHYTA